MSAYDTTPVSPVLREIMKEEELKKGKEEVVMRGEWTGEIEIGEITCGGEVGGAMRFIPPAPTAFDPPSPLPSSKMREEVRMAEDGNWYTKKEFETFYGGLAQWRKGKREPTEQSYRRRRGMKEDSMQARARQDPGWRRGNGFGVLAM